MRLTDAELWELRCWDERVKNARIVLGVCEGEATAAQQRIRAAHGLTPDAVLNDDGTITQPAPRQE